MLKFDSEAIVATPLRRLASINLRLQDLFLLSFLISHVNARNRVTYNTIHITTYPGYCH